MFSGASLDFSPGSSPYAGVFEDMWKDEPSRVAFEELGNGWGCG